MQRIYIKKQAGMGCHLCEVHCKVEHSQSEDSSFSLAGFDPAAYFIPVEVGS